MHFKIIFLCVQALMLKSISAQCLGNAYAENLAYAAYAPYGAPVAPVAPAAYTPNAYTPYAPTATYNPAMLSASNGGGLAVTSSSPISPYGVSMTSENAFEGPLAVGGQIPFLGAVGVEGALPTAGAGAISYGSGNGNVAMLAEDLGGYSYGAVAPGYSAAYAPYGASPYSASPYSPSPYGASPYGGCY